MLEVSEDHDAGELADAAASILMKILYGARMGRWDLLKAVASLATCHTKWTKLCVKALFRLICYINSTTASALAGYLGDDPKDLRLRLYADADFVGDKDSFRSTSGAFFALVGPHSFVPLAAKTKKQSCVSHSTPDAEIVSIAFSSVYRYSSPQPVGHRPRAAGGPGRHGR
jgi:hypothetical protein